MMKSAIANFKDSRGTIFNAPSQNKGKESADSLIELTVLEFENNFPNALDSMTAHMTSEDGEILIKASQMEKFDLPQGVKYILIKN